MIKFQFDFVWGRFKCQWNDLLLYGKTILYFYALFPSRIRRKEILKVSALRSLLKVPRAFLSAELWWEYKNMTILSQGIVWWLALGLITWICSLECWSWCICLSSFNNLDIPEGGNWQIRLTNYCIPKQNNMKIVVLVTLDCSSILYNPFMTTKQSNTNFDNN